MTLGIDCIAGKGCLLSHTPSEATLPSCVFFLEGRCKRSKCVFAHRLVAPRARACADFALLGYCEKGGECEYQHVRQCPGSARRGVCDHAGCRLAHDKTAYERSSRLQSDSKAVSDWDGMRFKDVPVGEGHSLVLERHDEAKGVIMQKEFIQQEDFIRL